MSISSLQSNSFQLIDTFKQTLLDSVSDQNKKIITVAIIAFVLLAALWYGLRCYCASQDEQEAKMENLNKVRLAKNTLLQRLSELKVLDDTSINHGVDAFETYTKRKFNVIKSNDVFSFENIMEEIQKQIDEDESYPGEDSLFEWIATQLQEFNRKYLDNDILRKLNKLTAQKIDRDDDDEMASFAEELLSCHVNYLEMTKLFQETVSKVGSGKEKKSGHSDQIKTDVKIADSEEAIAEFYQTQITINQDK